MRPGLALLAPMLLLPACLQAQQVRTAVVPHDITVGDVFHVIIEVAPVSSGTVSFPDSLLLPQDLEPAGRVQVRHDTVAAGPRWTAAYRVTGWRPGMHALAAAPVRLSVAGRTLSAEAVFPEVSIGSVLPADTAGVQAKPARDVLGADRVWWPWLLLAALLALLAAAAAVWLRRRRRTATAPVRLPALSARDAALLALDRARTSGALEAGDYKRFYSDVSSALRGFVAQLDPGLGTDLTTSELAAALRRAGQERATAELQRVLRAADLVKFARREPVAAEALEEWQRARDWVESYTSGTMTAQAA